MNTLGLDLGYLLIQIINLTLLVGIPLVLVFFIYRWMLGVQQGLERVEKRLQALDEHLEEVLDYLAEQEEGV